jgi:hypothetical protein
LRSSLIGDEGDRELPDKPEADGFSKPVAGTAALVVGSVRRELLDHVIVSNDQLLRR